MYIVLFTVIHIEVYKRLVLLVTKQVMRYKLCIEYPTYTKSFD